MTSSDHALRIRHVQERLSAAGAAGVVVTPGEDLFYLSGYRALPLERLTALVIPADGTSTLVVPELERQEAEHSPALEACSLMTWSETDDPFALVTSALTGAGTVFVDDHMWASRVFELARRHTSIAPAGSLISDLRAIKSLGEFASLRAAGAAIDWVHEQIPQFIRPGRTEREVGTDIARAILESGHVSVDFVIVGSGPNGASPHHSVSDRVIAVGDPIVIDIGGTMPDGYRSDCTRNYVLGTPPAAYLEGFAILEAAQRAARMHAGPGVTAESIDSAARDVLSAAGLGAEFVHRTGHGIGLETHEEPYIVQGSERVVVAGNAFSIEPGFYRRGAFGARIEDIVLCTEDGIESVNNTPRSLMSIS